MMQFQDQTRWSDQELELQSDETSRKFLAFFTDWFDAAERELEAHDLSKYDSVIAEGIVAKCARAALEATETKLQGFLGLEWIGQMMLLAEQHWVYGRELMGGLTYIERRAVELMAAVKMAELQATAATL